MSQVSGALGGPRWPAPNPGGEQPVLTVVAATLDRRRGPEEADRYGQPQPRSAKEERDERHPHNAAPHGSRDSSAPEDARVDAGHLAGGPLRDTVGSRGRSGTAGLAAGSVCGD